MFFFLMAEPEKNQLNPNKYGHQCEDCGRFFKRRGKRKYPDKCAKCAQRSNALENIEKQRLKWKQIREARSGIR